MVLTIVVIIAMNQRLVFKVYIYDSKRLEILFKKDLKEKVKIICDAKKMIKNKMIKNLILFENKINMLIAAINI